MKKQTLFGMIVSLAAVALLLGGCGGSYQARSVDLKSSLVNPDLLEKGTGDQALYRYQNPKVNLADYSVILIDPVIIRKDGELSASELENYKTLANNFTVYMNQELSKYFTIVTASGPGTMRVQAAITDADNSKPVRTILSFSPIGIGINLIKYTATGKQSAVGEITTELKVTDAQTGQLIGAALDRRVGGKRLSDAWDTWSNADEATKYWAKRLAYVLCMEKKLQGCVNPNE